MVETYNTIVERSARVYSVMPKSSLIGPIFYGFMGAVFLAFGLLNEEGILNIPVVMGAGFLIFAVSAYVANRRAYGVRRP
jgi:hypothetical protein